MLKQTALLIGVWALGLITGAIEISEGLSIGTCFIIGIVSGVVLVLIAGVTTNASFTKTYGNP